MSAIQSTIASAFTVLDAVQTTYTVTDSRNTATQFVYLYPESEADGPVKDAFIYEFTLVCQCVHKSSEPDTSRTILDGMVDDVKTAMMPNVDTRLLVDDANVITQYYAGTTYGSFEVAPEGTTAYTAEVRYFFRVEENGAS